MKKILTIATVVALFTTPAFADNDRNIRDVYKTVTRSVPYTEQVCVDVQVPIYGSTSQKDTTGEMIIGGIIGGVIGNQIGKGGGKNAATGIGAMTGAIIGNNMGQKDNEQIIGYKQQQQCSNQTKYNTTTEEVYSHSEVTFWYEGQKRILRFQK